MKKRIGMMRMAARTVHMDVAQSTVSRKACTEGLIKAATDSVNMLNDMMPEPFFFDVEPPHLTSENLPGTFVKIHLMMKISRFHELVYFILKHIPIINRYVAGPKIVSYLIPSKHAFEKNMKAQKKAVSE